MVKSRPDRVTDAFGSFSVTWEKSLFNVENLAACCCWRFLLLLLELCWSWLSCRRVESRSEWVGSVTSSRRCSGRGATGSNVADSSRVDGDDEDEMMRSQIAGMQQHRARRVMDAQRACMFNDQKFKQVMCRSAIFG